MKPILIAFFAAIVALAPSAWSDTTAGPPPGQKILVITGTDSMNDFSIFIRQSTAWYSCAADYNASGFLTAVQAHTVTVQTTVPALATLQTYDEVWDLRFSAANCQTTVGACGSDGISAAQQANYLSYIASGGSLFLMGDNGGYPGRNNPILAIANAVDSAGAFQTGGVLTNNDTQQGAYIDIAASTAAENFQSDYRDLTGTNRWIAAQYNGLIANWGAGYPVLKDQLTGQATAIAFDCANMNATYKTGKLMVAFDWQMMGGGGQVAYCGPPTYTGTTTGYNERFWENSIDFLVPGNACSTPTFTSTRTATRTATPTRTATATDTATDTSTSTPISSPTFTSTITPSATDTRTGTATGTASATATDSRTSSPTSTATPSPTPTRTMTPTSTESSIYTATDTYTASATPSSSPTATDTATRTATATVTPSATETATRTDTPSSTATATTTPTRTETSIYTATDTPTSSATPSATPSSTVTASRTATATDTPTPTGTASDTVTPSATATATATPTQTETPIYTATNTPTTTATPTASPSASATASSSASVTASGTSTVTVTSTPSSSASPSPSPSPTLTASASPTPSPSQTLSWTASATPIPLPHHVKISAYNSAGELVKLLFEGGAQYLPGDLALSADLIPGGSGSVGIKFPGFLFDPAQGGVINGISWSADNNSGQLVKGGVYYIKVEITDPFGQVTSLQHSVQVVDAAPQNDLSIYNSAGELVVRLPLPTGGTGHYASLRLPSDSYGAKYDGASGSVSGPQFQIMVTDERGSEYPLYWDGRNASGVPVASGSYTAELVYSVPGSGRHLVASKGFVVLQAGDAASLAGSYAAPNPSVHGTDVILYYPMSSQYRAVARLYTLAGELVAESEDPGQSGCLRFSAGSLSSGVYAAKIEKLSGAAVAARMTLKIAVVR